MSEKSVVENTPALRSRTSLAQDLRQLGIAPGMVVLVHSSLSKLGWVNGGPVAVIQALMDVLTERGTLVMPAHSGDNSDPKDWQHPPVPEAWHQVIRDTMPAFDPKLTPTRGIGRIPELFRTWPDVRRSAHPSVSFSAWGHLAEAITAGHTLADALGEGSPLARFYENDGYVLLLGAEYDSNTSFHLAEYRSPGSPRMNCGGAIYEAGRSVWKSYGDIVFGDELFPQIGHDFEKEDQVTLGMVGSAECRLFRQRAAVDFAVRWLNEYRSS